MVISQPEFSPEELHELLSGVMPDIPGYRVLRLIGRGGMSYVYLGVQKSLDRQVAIKVIAPEALKDEISKLRFEKEARTIARLQHPCIVGIYEVGRTEHGLLFYVLPYLARGHLGQRNFRDNEARIIEVLRSLLWALDYAHGRGVVHRDVKSENVLFDNADRPLLTDFGIAINRKDRSRVTGRGFAVGSGAHMPPEQARGEPVDGRADLYSLGVLTFEMLTGRLPYQNADPLGLALMHATDPVPRLPAERKHWQILVDRAMAKLPGERFADAQEMMAALDKVEITIAKQQRLLTRDLTPHIAPAWQQVKQAAWLGLARLNDRFAQLRGWLRPRLNRQLLAAAACLALFAAALLLWPKSEPSPAPIPIAATPAPTRTPNDNTEHAVASTASSSAEVLDVVAEDLPNAEIIEPISVPLPPGEQALLSAGRQIERRRLTQPAGDNAYESLLTAQQLLPDAPELAPLAERWLETARPYILQAIEQEKWPIAQGLLERSQRLADLLLGGQHTALNATFEAVAAPLRADMQQALAKQDVAALQQAKQQAGALGLSADLFKPYWSQTIVAVRLGDRIGGASSPWVLVRLPAGDTPGLAMLDRTVTRADYLRFIDAQKRPAANCKIRTAMFTMKKRSVAEPGFNQQADHPAVCVSHADALAYAAWRSAAENQRYRLPNRDEWQTWVPTDAAGSQCAAARCADEGTRPASRGAQSRLGVHSAAGNVREWLGCGAGCTTVEQRGFSWRDRSDTRQRDEPVDGTRGYDDIGFRLVREVERAELERR
ncbi:bifunctional serine/threonine-protein kinase/formylglycine-generating enzyme family protein [Pseudomarimonas arenosa]|uniref:Protein kinase n=1 Tax=Pseudomarimonas arenosa TaxID=2774145 RepID=A0AAW3ZQD3_9GAMM|nr:bifunctional serine/threonine-protein kinase/formylglycine-generating enzyme family protein [Pseudomarimonas arenosa]MBD8527349.1 protein kinase [Pseudomarimonas arenosa]